MEWYNGMELPEHVLESIRNTDIEQYGLHKDTQTTKEDIVNALYDRCLQGTLLVVHEKDINLFFTDQAPYVIKMDSLRGPKASLFDYIKVVRKVIKFYLEKTETHKLETRTPFKELTILAKRGKWEHEGTFKESYQMQDGSFADELSFGLILRRELKCL